jgi:hypothetical protein
MNFILDLMQNALIYSPRFDGHRQVYIYVMSNILQELGFKIYVAGNAKQDLNNLFYIDKLKRSNEASFIDTSNFDNGGYNITGTELLKLQNDYKIDLTVFAEADNHLLLFASQIFKRKHSFRGRMVGVFMRPFYFYRRMGLLNTLRFIKHFPSRWKYDERFFYEFLFKRLSIFNVALCIDENFVSHHRYFTWLPDVFQQYAELVLPDERSEQRIWIEKLSRFKERNCGNFLFLYFGTTQHRRGYDLLLKLAEDTRGCFIHCGLRDNNEMLEYDTNQLRASLKKDGRLFETDEYIVDPLCIEYFFKSVSHLILPYRKYYGSSGVMLQALDYGIPVLSPEYGITGYRIKNYKLGMAYKYKEGDANDVLVRQFDLFKLENPDIYSADIKKYMNCQSIMQLKKVLINSFTSSNLSITEPYTF